MSAFKIENETIADGFYACPAVYEDAESITGLLVRTAEWLRDRGSNQWSGLLKGQDIHDITGSIEKGHVFVFKKDEELAAVVMLLCLHRASGTGRFGETMGMRSPFICIASQ